MINYSVLAMQSLVPNCEFSWVSPYNYKDINWYDSRKIPTEKEWQDEKARLISYQPKQNCKDEAKKRIANSDWSVLPDVNITNKSEFESYRSQLRNLIINPVEDPIFPTEPNPIWSN